MKYVYPTDKLKRYRFPTHVNDLVIDRTDAVNSEVFMVVLEPGEAPPMHKHDDTEQVYYIIEGHGTLTVGDRKAKHAIKPTDVVCIPPSTWHSIQAEGGPVKYLCVDCFSSEKGKLENSWDEHVQAVCAQQGWNYEDVAPKR